jgi:hypothetical protein
MSQPLATRDKRFRQFSMAPGDSLRHPCDKKTEREPSWYGPGDDPDIKALVAKEVRRQRFDEQQREFMKEVEKGRRAGPPEPATLSWGAAGAVPAPQCIDDETFRRLIDVSLDPRQLTDGTIRQAGPEDGSPVQPPMQRCSRRGVAISREDFARSGSVSGAKAWTADETCHPC